jgi:hypothetical protein
VWKLHVCIIQETINPNSVCLFLPITRVQKAYQDLVPQVTCFQNVSELKLSAFLVYLMATYMCALLSIFHVIILNSTRCKIVIDNTILDQVNMFTYLEYKISYKVERGIN